MNERTIENLVYFVKRSKDVIFEEIKEEKNKIINILETLDKEMNLSSQISFSENNYQNNWVKISGVFKKNNNYFNNFTFLISINSNEFSKIKIGYNINIKILDETLDIKNLKKINIELIKNILLKIKNEEKIKIKNIQKQFKSNLFCSNSEFIHKLFCGLFHNDLDYEKYGIMKKVVNNKKSIILTTDKPLYEPRDLSMVDSWQVVIPDLNNYIGKIKEDFIKELAENLIKTAKYEEEKVWYFGIDGKVEKPQIVISNNRGIIYVQIYQYGNSLYVSWQSFINFGHWQSKEIAEGFSKEYDKNIILASFVPARIFPNEYDLQDLVCLSEWVHSQITKILKIAIKENKIDQEIDFKILKGSRENLLKKDEGTNMSNEKKSFGFQKKE